MDKFDQAIIDHLSRNARQPINAIAETIGLSRSAVNERIRKLEQQGTIKGYTLRLGASLARQDIAAYFELTFRPFDLAAIKQQIQSIPEVRQAHALSGNTDVLVFVEASSMEQLSRVRQTLAELSQLEKIVTSTALERLV